MDGDAENVCFFLSNAIPNKKPYFRLMQSRHFKRQYRKIMFTVVGMSVGRSCKVGWLFLRGRTLILYLAKISKLIEAKIHRWEGKRQQCALDGGLFCHTEHNRDLFFTTLTSFASCWHSCFRKALSWETDSAWRPDIVQDIPSTSACYSALTQP